MNKITTVELPETTVSVIGIDLAKNVFALHGINSADKPVLVRPSVRREQLLALLLAQLSPCVIGMEACSGAHTGPAICSMGAIANGFAVKPLRNKRRGPPSK